jgi:phosphatidylglycerophosphatase C
MNLALFDFDGTITTHDTFTPFLHFSSTRRRIVLGTAALLPLVLAYRLRLLPATKMRALGAYVAFRGRNAEELSSIGRRYSQTLARLVRPEALEKIRWHQAQGDEVVVVSASLQPYLRGFCDEHRIALICTELEHDAGTLTGRYKAGDCTGHEKARRVRAAYDLARYPVIYAYGDTPEDEALLGLATKRYYRWRERVAG